MTCLEEFIETDCDMFVSSVQFISISSPGQLAYIKIVWLYFIFGFRSNLSI